MNNLPKDYIRVYLTSFMSNTHATRTQVIYVYARYLSHKRKQACLTCIHVVLLAMRRHKRATKGNNHATHARDHQGERVNPPYRPSN